MPIQKEVIVYVTTDPTDARGYRIDVIPDPVTLSVKRGEEVMWRCYQGELVIEFAKSTPFTSNLFRCERGGASCSGVPQRGRERSDPYKYSVTVKNIPGDNRSYREDPGIIVEN